MTKTRTETDSLGTLDLPADALYGIATKRGAANFDISPATIGAFPEFLRALARIKRACALANLDCEVIPREVAEAICAAACEVEDGQHQDQFIINIMEGSGGTSINMNINEVLANRALQLLGDVPGHYGRIHPNDHVNTGQSTNDVVPAAIKLAIFEMSATLIDALNDLSDRLFQKADAFADVLRVGRTCLQAGQPMMLGQAFGGYASAVRRQADNLQGLRRHLLELPLGGTAIGTGLGAASGFKPRMYDHLQAITGAPVRPGGNAFDAMQNADTFSRISADIRVCAEVIGKIASDLVLLGSDGHSGLGEIRLPAVQAGSSIMPGKINPVLPMMMQQVAFAAMGNDTAVSIACQQGVLEINHFEPLIASRLFDTLNLLTQAVRIFSEECIVGLEADPERSLSALLKSPAIATIFVKQLGYSEVTRLVRAAESQNRTFADLVIEKGYLTREDLLAKVREAAICHVAERP